MIVVSFYQVQSVLKPPLVDFKEVKSFGGPSVALNESSQSSQSYYQQSREHRIKKSPLVVHNHSSLAKCFIAIVKMNHI